MGDLDKKEGAMDTEEGDAEAGSVLLPGSSRHISSLRSLHMSVQSLRRGSLRSDITGSYPGSLQHLGSLLPREGPGDPGDGEGPGEGPGEVTPPDGGYGWVVVAAAFFPSWAIGSLFVAFSILYVEWTDYFESEKGITGWIGSIYMSSSNYLSFFFSILVRRYGCRTVGLIGALVACIGLFTSAFAPSLTFLYLSYGLVTGSGVGMLFLSTTVIVQQYFTRRRALAAGVAASGLSVGAVTAAPLTQLLLDHYGWRGTLIFWAAVLLQCCVFAALYRPLGQAGQQESKHIYKGKLSSSDLKLNLKKKTTKTSKDSKKRKGFSPRKYCDFSILKNPSFVLYCVGTMVANLGVIPFYIHTPGRAVFIGIERHLVAVLPTVIGTCTATSRIVFGFVANLSCTNRLLQYSISILIGGCILTSYSLATNFSIFVIYVGCIGALNGMWLTIQTTILADLLDVSVIALSQSFISASTGTASLLSIPLAGFIFDICGDYDKPFYVCGSLQILGGFILLCIPIIEYKKQKS